MSEKAMVLCSGGVDSTTCLALAIEKHGKENVCALSIYYGQNPVTTSIFLGKTFFPARCSFTKSTILFVL